CQSAGRILKKRSGSSVISRKRGSTNIKDVLFWYKRNCGRTNEISAEFRCKFQLMQPKSYNLLIIDSKLESAFPPESTMCSSLNGGKNFMRRNNVLCETQEIGPL
ncbi:MAG: hypothetical protein KY428_05100, partial [Bacteroidetes bacterium]|nr:hypothetical protein [Bacteroidota bacterium]